MEQLTIRQALLSDLSELSAMCHCLWPDTSAAEHARDLQSLLSGRPPGTLPSVVMVSEGEDGRITGFVEVSLRSHADGCDPSHLVGFIEGWYVAPPHRRVRIGTRLIATAEEWARNQGCTEMASDTWLDNLESQLAHEALGFEIVDRCVHYRKRL